MITLGQRVKIHLGDGVTPHVAPAAGGDTAIHDAEIGIGDDKGGINEHLHAQARALGAGAVGVIEGEEPRRQLFDGDAAVLTGVILREGDPSVFTHQIDDHQASGKRKRRLR